MRFSCAPGTTLVAGSMRTNTRCQMLNLGPGTALSAGPSQSGGEAMKMQPLMEPSRNRPALYSHEIATPVGPMLAVSSEDALYLLEFFTRRNLDAELANLRRNAEIISGRTSVSRGLERELADYFAGRSATFETPLKISGSDFQRSVWTQLRT